jgi:hypothetical protein
MTKKDISGDRLTQQMIEGAKQAFGNHPKLPPPTPEEKRAWAALDRWATQNKKVWGYLDDPDPIPVEWLQSEERAKQLERIRAERNTPRKEDDES